MIAGVAPRRASIGWEDGTDMAGDSTNTILLDSDRMRWHTDLGLVLAAFGGLHRRYNWLLSGGSGVQRDGRPQWLTGDGLSSWIETRRSRGSRGVLADEPDAAEAGRAVYWGVLSGFEAGEQVDLAAGPVPHAEGNWDFWRPYPRPQHPRAAVEVVCFRGMLTLLLAREPEFARRFRASFPEALDLDGYIDEHVRPWLASWADAARRMPAGTVATATVVRADLTDATVELAPFVRADLAVKQMRAAGFGPSHWFALSDHLPVGRRVTVRVTGFDAVRRSVTVDFLRDGPASPADPAMPVGQVPAHSRWLHRLLLRNLPVLADDPGGVGSGDAIGTA